MSYTAAAFGFLQFARLGFKLAFFHATVSALLPADAIIPSISIQE